MKPLNSPDDAVPLVGLYVCAASLLCTLAMAADAFQGFQQRKLWFPCRFFTLNAASITLIAIAMKLPVDLTTIRPYSEDLDVKEISIFFLIAMLANFLPSLGLMDDKELLFNMIALGILIITIFVNICISIVTKVSYAETCFEMLPLLVVFSVALAVPSSRRTLEHRYNKFQGLTSNNQEINFSTKELVHNVKKYWMMAETGNPQLVISCSQVYSALGVICLLIAVISSINLVLMLLDPFFYLYGQSAYRWSINLIIIVQLIGALVASIAPTFRCFTAISYFYLSKNGRVNHLNIFRVEEHWTHRLQQWKLSHVYSHIPGSQCKFLFYILKNVILNFCIALQVVVVVICKLISLLPRSFLILFSCCWYFYKPFLKRYKKESNVSSEDLKSELKEYMKYVLQIEDDVKLPHRVLTNALKSINQLLKNSESKEPSNLMKLLEKSTGFKGVVEFDNDQIPPLHSEDTPNSWSLVVVTLTAIVSAVPNIANDHLEQLLSSMRESLHIVKHIEESLNPNSDLVKARKAARRAWTEVEVRRKWLKIDLRKKAHKGKTSKEILQSLGNEAVKIVIQLKSGKKASLGHSLHEFIVASSMYRISHTILLRYNGQENWPSDEDIFEWISTIIADIICACFTNLPRVINMMCHNDAIEKRIDSIQTAAQLLGKSRKILKILKARQLPNLDLDSLAYIDKWHALPKGEIPNGCVSPYQVQLASSSSNESVMVTINV